MSTQRFSSTFREALWETYRKKCFYCEGELLLKVMEVDHVLPEHLHTDWQAVDTIRRRIGIGYSFSIVGFENLVPACSPCNSKKGETILADGLLGIILARVRDNVPAVEAAILKRRSERDLENTLRAIARSIEAGKFTSEELLRELEAYRKFPDGLWGASPNAPPFSPEQTKYHANIAADSRVIFLEHAVEQMRSRDLTPSTIAALIYSGIDELRHAEPPAARFCRSDCAWAVLRPLMA